jgi:mannose-6-phosphate isomerase-like protein (cupin superfamily)
MLGILGENRKIKELQNKYDLLIASIKDKVYISAEVDDIKVEWEIPEEFIKVSNKYTIGTIKWRRYRVDFKRSLLSADNKWLSGSSITKHKHANSTEVITSIHGSGFVAFYNNEGKIEREVEVPEGEIITIPAGVVHSARCEQDWDMVVKFIKK